MAGATVIGTDYGTQFRLVDAAIISVDPAKSFQIVSSIPRSIDWPPALPHTPVCRSIDAAHSETAELAAVDSFATTLRPLDPDCLSNPENWWTVIVEKMRDGPLLTGQALPKPSGTRRRHAKRLGACSLTTAER